MLSYWIPVAGDPTYVHTNYVERQDFAAEIYSYPTQYSLARNEMKLFKRADGNYVLKTLAYGRGTVVPGKTTMNDRLVLVLKKN